MEAHLSPETSVENSIGFKTENSSCAVLKPLSPSKNKCIMIEVKCRLHVEELQNST